ncbi:MAG: hypothetical protein ACRYGR_09000 [Janthinobacterium lividum]
MLSPRQNQNLKSTRKLSLKLKSLKKNDEGFINEPTSKDTPVVIKEKIKTKGTPNLQQNITSQNEKDAPLEVPVISPIKYIRKKHHTIFENFWTTKCGFTYEEFIKMFRKLGGYVDENTSSSHMRLTYQDENSIEHTGGIWKMHGGITEFNEDSASILKVYLEKCGLILDRVFPAKSDDKIPM